MTDDGIEENTLGIVVGKEGRRFRSTGFTRARRTVATARRLGLGTEQLGLGMVAASAIVILYDFWRFLQYLPRYEMPWLAGGSWVVFLLTSVAVAATVQLRGRRMPTRLFALMMGGYALVVVLDAAATWGLGAEASLTSALAVGAALLAVTTLRETAEILVATVVLAIILAAAAVADPRSDPRTFAPDLLLLSTAVVPPVLGVAVVRTYRRMVQLAVDRVLVQSTVSAPRYAVGMLQSEELATLDLEAETLLESVAVGTVPLPLRSDAATEASTLANRLRRHLVEDRRDTWLSHAIAESEFLGARVRVHDPDALAGLMDSAQRDGLLSAVWLLVSDPGRSGQGATVELGPRDVGSTTSRLYFPVVVQTTGVPRHRVDPATWESVSKVGPFVESTHRSSIRIVIECAVGNPAAQ